MPVYLLIGIPLAVAVLLWGILSLPDEEEKDDELGKSKKPKAKKK